MITYHRRTLIPTTNDLNGKSLANSDTQPYWTLWQDHNVYNEVSEARLYIPIVLHSSPFFIFYGYSGERLFDLATDDWTWGSNTELEVPKLHTDLPDYDDTYHCVVTAGFHQHDVDMGAVFVQDHISADQQHVDGAVIAEWVSRDWNEEKTLTATPTGSETERWSFFELTNPRTNVPSWSKYQAFADNGGGYVLVVYGWRADPYENGDQLFKLYGNDNQLLVEGTDYETEPRVSSETSNPMWYDVDIDIYNTLVFIPYAVFNSKISGGQLTVRYTRMGTVAESELEAAQAAGNIPVVVDQCGKTTYHQYGYYSDAEQYTGKPEEAAGLKVWLPFDESATLDKCGNTWTATGSPTISATNAINGNALRLDGASYLQMSNSLTLGGKDFAIDGWVYMNSATAAQACLILLEKEQGYPLLHVGKVSTYPKRLHIGLNPAADVSTERWESSYLTATTTVDVANTRVHFELDYQFNEQLLAVYINGTRACYLSGTPQFDRMNFTLKLGYFYRTWGSDSNREYFFNGYLDELRIFDGTTLHTSDFTPPTADDYAGKLAVCLPFDTSATEDTCGNAWVASGWMSIEDNALQMIPASVLEMSGTLTLGGRDFTIDWLYGHTDPDGMGDKTRVYLFSDATLTNLSCWVTDRNELQFTLNDGTAHGVSGYCDTNSASKRFTHHAIVYQHSEGELYFFVDGRLRNTTQCTISATTISRLRIGHPDFDATYTRPGELAKFRIFNGVAVWTSQFDVPMELLYD